MNDKIIALWFFFSLPAVNWEVFTKTNIAGIIVK